jgi:hypothetical protein
MTEKDFIYWLQGFFELSGAETLNKQQVKAIKEHMALVMKKVTPSTVQPPFPVTIPNIPYVPPTTTGDKITIPPIPKIGGYEIICSTAEAKPDNSLEDELFC